MLTRVKHCFKTATFWSIFYASADVYPEPKTEKKQSYFNQHFLTETGRTTGNSTSGSERSLEKESYV